MPQKSIMKLQFQMSSSSAEVSLFSSIEFSFDSVQSELVSNEMSMILTVKTLDRSQCSAQLSSMWIQFNYSVADAKLINYETNSIHL